MPALATRWGNFTFYITGVLSVSFDIQPYEGDDMHPRLLSDVFSFQFKSYFCTLKLQMFLFSDAL